MNGNGHDQRDVDEITSPKIRAKVIKQGLPNTLAEHEKRLNLGSYINVGLVLVIVTAIVGGYDKILRDAKAQAISTADAGAAAVVSVDKKLDDHIKKSDEFHAQMVQAAEKSNTTSLGIYQFLLTQRRQPELDRQLQDAGLK